MTVFKKAVMLSAFISIALSLCATAGLTDDQWQKIMGGDMTAPLARLLQEDSTTNRPAGWDVVFKGSTEAIPEQYFVGMQQPFTQTTITRSVRETLNDSVVRDDHSTTVTGAAGFLWLLVDRTMKNKWIVKLYRGTQEPTVACEAQLLK